MSYNLFGSSILARLLSQDVSGTGDISIAIPFSKYLIDRFIVEQVGANSLTLLVATLRTAATGGGTSIGAIGTAPTAAGVFCEIASPLGSTRSEATLYFNKSIGAGASTLANIFLIGTPL